MIIWPRRNILGNYYRRVQFFLNAFKYLVFYNDENLQESDPFIEWTNRHISKTVFTYNCIFLRRRICIWNERIVKFPLKIVHKRKIKIKKKMMTL